MTEYGTIKIPREEYERHNERREEMNLSWAEYIDGQAPDVPNGAELDPKELVDMIAAEADGAGRVDDSELAREIAAKIDYVDLSEKVARKVTEELNDGR